MKIKLFLIALIVLTANIMAQEKTDSTLFKYHIDEFKKAQLQLRQLDTIKVKWSGISEYHYSRILEEQKKLTKKENKK